MDNRERGHTSSYYYWHLFLFMRFFSWNWNSSLCRAAVARLFFLAIQLGSSLIYVVYVMACGWSSGLVFVSYVRVCVYIFLFKQWFPCSRSHSVCKIRFVYFFFVRSFFRSVLAVCVESAWYAFTLFIAVAVATHSLTLSVVYLFPCSLSRSHSCSRYHYNVSIHSVVILATRWLNGPIPGTHLFLSTI